MNDDTSRETTGSEIQDPLSALAMAATATHEMFRSYIAAGFTEQQALYLTAQVLTASMRGPQG
jgi:hypothetical protein